MHLERERERVKERHREENMKAAAKVIEEIEPIPNVMHNHNPYCIHDPFMNLVRR